MSSTALAIRPKAPGATPKKGRSLLDLPPELVIHIASFLEPEVLPSARLACKRFEAITFDRFAEEFFAHTYCWMGSNDAFMRLHRILTWEPRLREKLLQVTLTIDILEDRSSKTMACVAPNPATRLPRLRFVGRPAPATDEMREAAAVSQAQASAIRMLYETNSYPLTGGPNPMLVHHVLWDLQRLPQRVLVNLDFIGQYGYGVTSPAAVEPVVAAVVDSATKIDTLRIFPLRPFVFTAEFLARHRSGLVASMSTLKTFESRLAIQGQPQVFRMVADILVEAKQLSHFDFSVGDINSVVSESLTCLNATSFTNLTNLALRATRVPEKSMLNILARLRQASRLTRLALDFVQLQPADGGWTVLLREMAGISSLVHLELENLQVRTRSYKSTMLLGYDGNWEHHADCTERMKETVSADNARLCKVRFGDSGEKESVALGLQRLLSLGDIPCLKQEFD